MHLLFGLQNKRGKTYRKETDSSYYETRTREDA